MANLELEKSKGEVVRAVDLYQQVLREHHKRGLGWDSFNTIALLSVAAALNNCNIEDTLDRYEEISEIRSKRDLPGENWETNVLLTIASLVLPPENQ